MDGKDRSEGSGIGLLDLFVGFVSIYSIFLLFVDNIVDVTPQIATMLIWADNGLCALFLVDLVLRWRKAKDKLRFWRWGWLDLLASIPMLPWFRWARSVRLLRVLRVLRAVRGVRMLHEYLFSRRRLSVLTLTFFIFYSIIMMGGPAILIAESGAEGANIKTAGQAVWWVFETMSTVGYGDFYPVTTVRRLVGVVVMILCVGMFGAITASVLSLFGLGGGGSSSPDEVLALRREIDRLKSFESGNALNTSGGQEDRNGCNLT
ncbi:MAG: ion transporter [Opitutales bacterium]